MATRQKSMDTSVQVSWRKTYYPPKTFDDDLAALVDLFKKNGWSFSGVDLGQLDRDAFEQREERLAYDANEAQWRKVRVTFGDHTEHRHRRYSAALSAARGAFRHDKAITAQLEKFRFKYKRRIGPRVEAVGPVFVVDDMRA